MLARREIAERIFVVPPQTLTDTTTDHQAVVDLGVRLRKGIKVATPALKDRAAHLWDDWMDKADTLRVKLPYRNFHQRFSGTFPSFVPEEQELIKRILWPRDVTPSDTPRMFASIGAVGAGKSTLLKNIAAREIPNAMRIDPDEGVLENLGPYLFARLILQGTARPPVATTPEEITKERNLWRLPPYNTFRWASNVINTHNAREAVNAGLDIEFHWTGAGAFGLKLIKEGYKEAGYNVDLIMLVTSLQERQMRESKRLRPATPEDFTNKAVDFIKLLPQSLPVADHLRIFDGDYPVPQLAFAQSGSAVLHNSAPNVDHILSVMQGDIDAAVIADKTEHRQGLQFVRELIEKAPRMNFDTEKPAPRR